MSTFVLVYTYMYKYSYTFISSSNLEVTSWTAVRVKSIAARLIDVPASRVDAGAEERIEWWRRSCIGAPPSYASWSSFARSNSRSSESFSFIHRRSCFRATRGMNTKVKIEKEKCTCSLFWAAANYTYNNISKKSWWSAPWRRSSRKSFVLS